MIVEQLPIAAKKEKKKKERKKKKKAAFPAVSWVGWSLRESHERTSKSNGCRWLPALWRTAFRPRHNFSTHEKSEDPPARSKMSFSRMWG
jgi:hypothetical protein